MCGHKETSEAREERIKRLLHKRKGGKVIQEELFLEDAFKEKSIRKIYDLWETYEFEDEYPAIDKVLYELAQKEKQNGTSPKRTDQLKEELRAVFNCEEVGIVEE